MRSLGRCGKRRPLGVITSLLTRPLECINPNSPVTIMKIHAGFRRLCILLLLYPLGSVISSESILILDGRNNHDWERTTTALKATLESSGRYTVTVATAPEDKAGHPPQKPKVEDASYLEAKVKYDALVKSLKPDLDARWANWRVDFAAHDAVVLNYNGPEWPEAMKNGFVDYVRSGGGVVLIHAANNGFANWQEFNSMIGLGWRKGGFGRCLIINNDGSVGECCQGDSSGHGSKHPFVVTHRQPDHPILAGLPMEWMHAKDELYHHMRGPAQNVTILASAFSDEKQNGTGRHEPVLWEVAYGKGRVVVCTLGHVWRGDTDQAALDCLGFQTLFDRSVEYAATGQVTSSAPSAFPTDKEVFSSKPATVAPANPYAPLSPAEQAKTFVLPEGYVVDCIASEPMVEEPVLAVWDANGALYVAEMRSYMQDENGTGTKTLKNGRIKRLTDTNGDGIMDESTVFVDGLNLPRAILPLDDRIAVVETDSTAVWSYRDTDGDGIAEERSELFKGAPGDPAKSVEHQNSGLVWNLDNRIYLSYANQRYRFTDGTWTEEPIHPLWAQWGITHDDEGRLFYSTNSDPALGFDLARHYWLHISRRNGDRLRSAPMIDPGLSWDIGFLNAKNLCEIDDRGGKAAKIKTFTSLCGQSIYRDSVVPDWNGDYFVCDPTIHVVRRAKLTRDNGRVRFSNAHGSDEFLLSPHILFRPVNTALSPDGSLIVVDMYRGIIQDAPWLNPGAREFLAESGLAAVNQHGRLWRIRKKDATPHAAPGMLQQPTSKLLAHLSHPSGWWRDTAQRQIILRQDRQKVLPALVEMAQKHENPLARLHAIWTLEGCGEVRTDFLADPDPRVRSAAVKVCESRIAGTLTHLAAMAATEQDGDVAKQLILTLGFSDDDTIVVPAVDSLIRRHLTHEGVFLAACVTFWKHPTPFMKTIQDGSALAGHLEVAALTTRWNNGFAQWQRGLAFPEAFPQDQRKRIEAGETLYFQTCVSCHGPDGKGVGIPGTDLAIAPPLAGSHRVKGHPDGLLPVLMNGLMGPIDGKTYQAGFMAPAAALGVVRDDRLAEIVSYIRYAWGNNANPVSADEVKAARNAAKDRPTPWTDDELKAITPVSP